MKIKGKKVILRTLSVNDAKAFCVWLGDPELVSLLSPNNMPQPSLKEEKDWIQKAIKNKDEFHLAIDTIDGEHIGSIGLNKIDKINQKAEFGIMIGNKKYWGQGIGTEACYLICQYGFTKLKLHRIYLKVFAFNVRGIKSYQKVGFKKEGILRQDIKRGKFRHDTIIMGLLKNELTKSKI
jgi:RimJ/RimL family protein N-acetyltransferase